MYVVYNGNMRIVIQLHDCSRTSLVSEFIGFEILVMYVDSGVTCGARRLWIFGVIFGLYWTTCVKHIFNRVIGLNDEMGSATSKSTSPLLETIEMFLNALNIYR